MKKTKFTETQIVSIIKQQEAGILRLGSATKSELTEKIVKECNIALGRAYKIVDLVRIYT